MCSTSGSLLYYNLYFIVEIFWGNLPEFTSVRHKYFELHFIIMVNSVQYYSLQHRKMFNTPTSVLQETSPTALSVANLFYFLLISTLILCHIYWRVSRRHMIELAEKLPGPDGLPLIGHALDFLSATPSGNQIIILPKSALVYVTYSFCIIRDVQKRNGHSRQSQTRSREGVVRSNTWSISARPTRHRADLGQPCSSP